MSIGDEQTQSKEARSKHDKQQQFKDIKSACREDGSELMTPLAIAALFDISGAAIRMARKHGFIDAYVTLSVTGKPVELILLEAAPRLLEESGTRGPGRPTDGVPRKRDDPGDRLRVLQPSAFRKDHDPRGAQCAEASGVKGQGQASNGAADRRPGHARATAPSGTSGRINAPTLETWRRFDATPLLTRPAVWVSPWHRPEEPGTRRAAWRRWPPPAGRCPAPDGLPAPHCLARATTAERRHPQYTASQRSRVMAARPDRNSPPLPVTDCVPVSVRS